MNKLDNITTEVLQQITTDQAWHYHIIPFKIEPNNLHFFADERKTGNGLQDELELLFGKNVLLKSVESEAIKQALSSYYRRNTLSGQKEVNTLKNEKDFLQSLIREAKQLGSSDIHMEPYEEICRIRFRIDGVLIERYQLPKDQYPSLVNKVKIQSNLDIAEKRLPQDGRIFFEEKNPNGKKQKFDIRVSSLPTLHGEKIVMRLLSSNDTDIDIHRLGFQKEDLDNFLEGVNRPNGMVLISGPTGSGKTTTLYSTLQLLNQTDRNILTIEDPIEYTLEGINQVQLKEAIGLNFASAMRTFLRQDPDIIMVGEIRDVDTASMAIRASLTGHLVMSTIHTNSAWGIVARLIDMGVPAYLLADTLNTAVAQRLLRLLCPHCKAAKPIEEGLFPRNYQVPKKLLTHYIPIGCDRCHFTGYKGRKAVYEVIQIDGTLSDRIKTEELRIHGLLKEKGIKSLAENAFELLAEGLTSIKEVYPILASARS